MSEGFQTGFIDVHEDEDSGWWWRELRHGRLMLPRCDACNRCFFPPQPSCVYCGHVGWTGIESSGRATVYSWITVHRALDTAFADDVPYTIVAAELEEGVRLLGRLRAGSNPEAGLGLKAVLYDVNNTTFVGFEPA